MLVGSSFTRCTGCRSRLCPTLLHPDLGLLWPLMLSCCGSLLPVCSRCVVLVHLWMPTSFFTHKKLWAVALVKVAVGCALSVNSPWRNVHGATGARAVGVPGTVCMFDKPKRVNESRPPCKTQIRSRLLHQFSFSVVLCLQRTARKAQSKKAPSLQRQHTKIISTKRGAMSGSTQIREPAPTSAARSGLRSHLSVVRAVCVPGPRPPRASILLATSLPSATSPRTSGMSRSKRWMTPEGGAAALRVRCQERGDVAAQMVGEAVSGSGLSL